MKENIAHTKTCFQLLLQSLGKLINLRKACMSTSSGMCALNAVQLPGTRRALAVAPSERPLYTIFDVENSRLCGRVRLGLFLRNTIGLHSLRFLNCFLDKYRFQ